MCLTRSQGGQQLRAAGSRVEERAGVPVQVACPSVTRAVDFKLARTSTSRLFTSGSNRMQASGCKGSGATAYARSDRIRLSMGAEAARQKTNFSGAEIKCPAKLSDLSPGAIRVLFWRCCSPRFAPPVATPPNAINQLRAWGEKRSRYRSPLATLHYPNPFHSDGCRARRLRTVTYIRALCGSAQFPRA